jgi:hypothetical protein
VLSGCQRECPCQRCQAVAKLRGILERPDLIADIRQPVTDCIALLSDAHADMVMTDMLSGGNATH